MTRLKALLPGLFVLMTGPLQAKQISGITIPDTISLHNQQLVLNGAGIRSKFVFDIYIGALYLPQKTISASTAITLAGPKRVLMHFLYDEVEKDKLTDGWTEGFENNLTTTEFNRLKTRLEIFNQLFVTVRKGDEILLDFTPDKGTTVTINKQLKGHVPGEDFYRALLKVWLGDDPADEDLKSGMLAD